MVVAEPQALRAHLRRSYNRRALGPWTAQPCHDCHHSGQRHHHSRWLGSRMSATPATFESSACRCAGLRPAIEPGLIERDHTDAPSTQKAGVAWSRRVHPDEHNAHLSASPNLLGPVSVGRGRSGTPTVLLLPRPCRRRKTTTDY